MAKIDGMADAYMKEHSAGNSYIDEKTRLAYETGMREGISELKEWLDTQLTPFYQRLTDSHIKKMLG